MNIVHIVLIAAQMTAPTINVQCSDSNNVIVQGQPARFYLSPTSPESPRRFAVTNFEGKIVRTGTATRVITVSDLPVGWYTLTVRTKSVVTRTPFAMVYPVPNLVHGPIAVDAANAWLVRPTRFADAARLLRLAGFGWVRERLAWREVEPKPGVFNWGRYDICTNAEASQGIRIDDIFHDIPAWARQDHATNRFPDDLRYAYKFCRKLAQHFHHKVDAWEVWNEADGGFSVDNADQYAAFLKACYLGFKSEDGPLKIAQVSMANSASRYEEQLYKNGTGSYFDIYNFHEYLNPMKYPLRAQGHFNLLRQAGVVNKPVWVTEAGVNDGETGEELSTTQARVQAEFIPRSYAMSLASGTSRHFFFVLPHYVEPGVEWGVLTANMLPYPGYSALAACAHFLGAASYLGRVTNNTDDKVILQAFSSQGKGVLVLWRNGQKSPLHLPAYLSDAQFFNALGTPVTRPTQLGQDPLFAVCRLSELTSRASRADDPSAPLGPASRLPALKNIVLRVLLPDQTIARNNFAYILGQTSTPFTVQVYNFGRSSIRGIIHLRIPRPWRLHVNNTNVNIPPMGLVAFTGNITLPQRALLRRIHLTGVVELAHSSHETSSPVELTLLPDPTLLHALATLQLETTVKWTINNSTNGSTKVSGRSGGSTEFTFTFTGPGDKWAYPRLNLAPFGDLSKYNAVSLQYRTPECAKGSIVRIMLAKRNGSVYFTPDGFPPSPSWRQIVVPLSSLVHGSFSAPDPIGAVTGHDLSELLVGLNTSGELATLEIRKIEFRELPE